MTRVERWERRSEVPLLLMAVSFLVAWAWPILDPQLEPTLETVLSAASWTVWAAFGVDFLVRLHLADQRWSYALRRWYDVVLIVAPLLRPLRVLRILAFARILDRTAANCLVGRVSIYVGGVAVAATGLGALAVLDVERSAPNANVRTPGDALWWATTTVTTVGYGDHFPVTTTGRLIAAALMLVGIAVVSSFTAIIAASLVQKVQVPRGGPDGAVD